MLVHSCFSRSVKSWYSTMWNGFQVTILDSDMLGSQNLDSVLIQPSFICWKIFSCLGQVSRELQHPELPKLGNIHWNRLKIHYYLIFCDSVSLQIRDMVNQIFFKNMICRGIISWRDTQWYPVTPLFWLLPAHFVRTVFQSISVEQCQMDTIHRAKLQYWNSCEC